MCKVFQVADSSTGRAWYENEVKYLGTFDSIAQAMEQLGDTFVRCYCNIKSA